MVVKISMIQIPTDWLSVQICSGLLCYLSLSDQKGKGTYLLSEIVFSVIQLIN